MIKNFVIVTLLLTVGALTGVCLDQRDTVEKAAAYIRDLESDFPDFADTTSGGDAYVDYYEKVGWQCE